MQFAGILNLEFLLKFLRQYFLSLSFFYVSLDSDSVHILTRKNVEHPECEHLILFPSFKDTFISFNGISATNSNSYD